MGAPIDELGGKTWDELEVRRHEDGRLMFPGELRRRDEKGGVVVRKVRVCVPVPSDHVAARVDAAAWFAKQKGLERDRDKDLFDEMEQLALLARAIRVHEPPHAQLLDHTELAGWDEASIQDIQERINIFKLLVDPREGELDDEQFWRDLLAVGRGATIAPLVDMSGPVQFSFILRMAKVALTSPEAQSWLRSSETSTPEP